MRCLNGLLLSLMVFALVTSAGRGAEPARAPVADMIRALGSEDFQEREAASKRSWRTGRPAASTPCTQAISRPGSGS